MADISSWDILDWSGLAWADFRMAVGAVFPWMMSSAFPCIVNVFPVLVGPYTKMVQF